jgi:uncharacterized protein
MWAAAVLILSALAVLLLIWVGQRRLIYFPARNVPAPSAVGLARVEAATLQTDDGITIHGWFVPGRGTASITAIVFNGNAGNRAYRAPLAVALAARGVSVLLFDYRGFGENAGVPTQRGLAADARAARAYLLGRRDVRPDRLVYFGESLGTAVATGLAVEHPPAALILRSPFTSMVDVGQFHYPVLPVRWLLRDRFASIDAIGRVAVPVLIVAGEHDSIVPLEQSRRLFDKAAGPKEMVVIEGADHNDDALLAGEQLIGTVVGFLDRTCCGELR